MTTITLETIAGTQRHFSKIVFVWLNHTVTGWSSNLQRFVYGDDLNGVYALGCDQQDPMLFAWFIPGGRIRRDQATEPDANAAHLQFRNVYGDRLVIALNKKPDYPTIETWVPNAVLTPETFGLPTFTGTTIEDFEEYCSSALEHLNEHSGWIVPVK